MKKYISLFVASFFLTATFFFIGPLEIYLSNANEFWFNLKTIFPVVAMSTIWSLGVCVLFGIVISKIINNKVLDDIYLGIVFGIALGVYCQAYFLNIDIGAMNGNRIEWGIYHSKMIVHLFILIVLVIASIIGILRFKSKFEKAIVALSSLLVLMQLASVISLAIPLFISGEEAQKATEKFLSSDHIYDVGSENEIVFVLDAFDSTYVGEILQNDIKDSLSDFIVYENYTGLYPSTIYSMAQILGGNIFRNEEPRLDWVESNSEDKLYEDELLSAGYDIGIYTDIPEDIPSRIAQDCINYTEANLRFYNFRTCFSLIYRLTACKYLPDIIKPYIWMDGTEFSSAATSDTTSRLFTSENSSFRDGMRGVTDDTILPKKQFKIIHLYGVHEPFKINEFGEDIEENWDKNIDAAKGCMRLVLEYIDRMKAQGVYEKSSIIITSDHGWHGNDGIISNPILLIKPSCYVEKECSSDLSNVGITLSDLPVSQADLPATILELAGVNSYSDYGKSVFDIDLDHSRERLYYQYSYEDDGSATIRDGNFCLIEYRINPESNDTDRFMLTGNEFTWNGEMINHERYCKTCQEKRKPSDYWGWKQLIHYHTYDYPE